MGPKRTARDFHVGWICAVQIEYVIACEVLDEEFQDVPPVSANDANIYTCGQIGEHLVVIACLPRGKYGLASAASVAKDMMRSFPAICVGVMVGIGGGAPTPTNDIRLGDIVVGTPTGRTNGVIHYEAGKTVQNQTFQYERAFNSPPTIVLNAFQKLSTLHERGKNLIGPQIDELLQRNPRLKKKYARPDPDMDMLFRSDFIHLGSNASCTDFCSLQREQIVQRPNREDDDVEVHYGLIASLDRLMKDASIRDHLAMTEGVLCFEMEAAGLEQFPCVVVRGICDYSDTHKNDIWQGYSAAVAAVYAQELLAILPSFDADHLMKDFREQVEKSINRLEDTVNTQAQTTNSVIGEGFASAGVQLSESFSGLKLHIDHQAKRNELLKSLEYPDMNRRYNDIKQAHDQTCQWMFLNTKETDPSFRFLTWLRSGSGSFWINGKPGSGKSTLMKEMVRIIEEEPTPLLLEVKSEQNPIVLKHFFWLSGSLYQRNLRGLLLSLLHQLLLNIEKQAVDPFDQPVFKQKKTSADWSEEHLSQALMASFGASRRPIWVFVDALDEVDPDENVYHILRLLDDAGKLPQVRMCLSSRPEPMFQTFFQYHPYVKVEEYTREDMRRCVTKCLEQHFKIFASQADNAPSFEHRLVSLIMRKAGGVFLWVYLALKSVTEGLSYYGDESEIISRIDALPGQIEQLYQHMWTRRNGNHDSCRRDAATYFTIYFGGLKATGGTLTCFQMMLASDDSLFDRCLSKYHKGESLNLIQEVEYFEKRFLARTAGLIEIWDHSVPKDPLRPKLCEVKRDDWARLHERKAGVIHRTAFNFLFGTEEGQRILSWSRIHHEQAMVRWGKTYLLSRQIGHCMLFAEDVLRCLKRFSKIESMEARYELLQFMNQACKEGFIRRYPNLKSSEDWLFYLCCIQEDGDPSFPLIYEIGWDSVMAFMGCLSYFRDIRASKSEQFSTKYLSGLLLSSIGSLSQQFDVCLSRWLLDQERIQTPSSSLCEISWIMEASALHHGKRSC